MNSENRLRKKNLHLFQAITLIYVISLISCNRNREKKTMTLSEQINTRDSIGAEKLSQTAHDEHIKDTITGTWNYYRCCFKGSNKEEAFTIVLKKTDHNDSITGTYHILTEGKTEGGVIAGYIITGKKAVAEFYKRSGLSKDKGKIELLDWNKKNYSAMKVSLLKAPSQPSFFPKKIILQRLVPREIKVND